MNEPNVERTRKHLQSKEVQERIQKRMQDARSKATVTISRAASLFDFSESQLREWEKRGLLKTDRPPLSQEGKTATGHRQYAPDELDKLALIREFMDQHYALHEIPQNIDDIWKQVLSEQQGLIATNEAEDGRRVHEVKHLPIDKRVDYMNQEIFWRYFVSQALRLPLLLICEDIPDTIAGLVLPLQKSDASNNINDPKDLSRVGPSLVGWLGRNRAFYSFLDPAPSFKFPSDFRIEQKNTIAVEALHDSPLIIVQRETRALFLSDTVVETIRRLLELVYEYADTWQTCFDYGMRDWVYQISDFTSGPNVTDKVLDSLTDMAIALGGKTPDGRNLWNFCALLLPQDTSLPLQQRNLTVRAHSKQAPPHMNVVILSARLPGITFRAYQSGHTIYRPNITYQDPLIAFGAMEQSTRSAIAIPIAGAGGLSVAALYIASDEANAFSEADQRALRFITRMIEELLSTYQARQQVEPKLTNLITHPELVDTSFRRFLSEEQFINDLEALLSEIHSQDVIEQDSEEVVSFIAVDIDDQSSFAVKYGDQVARNLSREVGLRLQGEVNLLSDPQLRRLYHVNADRYYLFLQGMKLDDARNKARSLHQALSGEYRIDARRIVTGRPILPTGLLELPKVTVRLGVSSYEFKKLKEILGRYEAINAVVQTRDLLMRNFDVQLNTGQREGGNVIVSWDNELWGWRPWPPSDVG
jgi:DNA-binding transcriptional MerR regulator/GGDEF domain-containing protein